MKRLKFSKSTVAAFTFLELLLTLTLISGMVLFALLFGRFSQVQADLRGQTETVVSQLRLAQSNAASGKDSGHFGIHFDPDTYVVFEGTLYDEAAAGNTEYELGGSLSFQNILLNGGGTDIIFSAPDGSTDQYGSLDLVSTPNGNSITITISSLGLVSH